MVEVSGELIEYLVIVVELYVLLPVIQGDQPVFVAVDDPEQLLRLLLGDIDGDLLAGVPYVVLV